MAKGKTYMGKITMAQVFGVLVGVLVIVQILAKIFSKWFPKMDLNLGFSFQIIIYGLILYLMFVFVVTKKAEVDKKSFFVLIILLGILLTISIYLLPKFLPEIFTFTNGNEQVQSFIGQAQSFLGGK